MTSNGNFIMHKELRRTWVEVVLTPFKALSKHWSRGTKEIHKNLK